MKVNGGVSYNTVARLPKYLRCLQEIEETGVDRVSSTEIANRLNLTPSQVRQDLSRFGTYGAQGYGYNVKSLSSGIRKILGIDKTHRVIMIGVGSVGSALLKHLEFRENNYCVIAGFDTNPELIGKIINGTPIYHADSLQVFLNNNKVDLCVLAVPKKHARQTALMVAKAGTPALWNLTNVDLELGDQEILIEDIHFLDSLFSLTFYLENA